MGTVKHAENPCFQWYFSLCNLPDRHDGFLVAESAFDVLNIERDMLRAIVQDEAETTLVTDTLTRPGSTHIEQTRGCEAVSDLLWQLRLIGPCSGAY
ncbi:hypothetical protein [Acetobacter thailandicus]|uniref:hypothetical protein n=1 Tax=Acetobacter thailandicus TaxID=1502842 RepID=UPI001BACA38F|nr:hypothetical protein [Acetobacter thailandicus]MBS0959800.1 hypothetical protein [Acetobacter thailandicus]